MERKFPFELAIIDFNGTLQDDLETSLDSVRFMCAHFGIPAPGDLKERFRSGISIEYMDFYRSIGIPERVTSEDLDGLRKQFFRSRRSRGPFLMEGAREMLSALFPHMDLVVVSGEVGGYVQERLQRLGIAHFFDSVHDGVRNKKEAFHSVIRSYEVAPHVVFAIDDGPEGVAAANELGAASVAFVHDGSYHAEDRVLSARPRVVVRSLRELAAAITNDSPP